MDKKVSDRRIRRTDQLLQEALLALILEKGYETVTIQEIIDRADVGRSTFYAHFQDKEDLFLSQFEALRTQFEQHLMGQEMTAESPWKLSLLMFQHAQSQHRLYQALAGKQGGQVMIKHIHTYLSALVREHLKQQMAGQQSDRFPPEIIAHYLTSSFMALMTWWLDNNLPYPAERMNDIFRQLTQPGLESILSRTSSTPI